MGEKEYLIYGYYGGYQRKWGLTFDKDSESLFIHAIRVNFKKNSQPLTAKLNPNDYAKGLP